MNIISMLNSALSADLAIDIGTDTTRICLKEGGIVLKEATMIAVDKNNRRIVAVGNDARKMLGKAPRTVELIKPVSAGVIADFESTRQMLRRFIESVCKKTLLKPRAVVSVPCAVTEVEKKAFIQLLQASGAREVFIIEEPVAAAAGAGCDVSLARGMLVADIGAGRSDIASISLGHTVINRSVTIAGDAFDEAIIKYIKKEHSLNIGTPTAENIKKTIGCVYPREKNNIIEVVGVDTATGLPKSTNVSSEEIREILVPLAENIAKEIKSVLEDTPPELQADIAEDGMLLTGGGAMLYGIEKYIRTETGIKTYITDNMDECVIRGLGGELYKLDLQTSPEKRYGS